MTRAMVPARICGDCGSWPCRCPRTAPVGEPRRRVRCSCGLWIESPTMLDPDVAAAVARHNVEPVHERWREQHAL